MTVSSLVRIDPEAQRLRACERYQVALPLPGCGFAQRRDQLIVGLRARRRTAAVLQGTCEKHHGIAGDGELPLAGLAPQLQRDLTAVADIQRRQPLRAGLA